MTSSNTTIPVPNKQSEFWQLVYLALPIMLSLCATNLIGFFDRTFLAGSSIESLEGYVSGFVLAVLFQVPLMRLTTLGQAFVSFYNSANERHRIGEAVWQMIWFSLFSMLIVLPIGYVIMPLVFGGSPVEESATTYFTCVLWGNFLFPLQAALSSFFIGQNKAKIVFITVVAAQCLHVLLDYFLIFGIENYIPPLGVLGAAIALISNRAVVCMVLFLLFLSKKQRVVYATGRYFLNWTVFFAQMRAGIPLSIAPFISMANWVAVSRLMALKGGDYLMVFSVGSSLTVCFDFMNEALLQAVMTSISGALGRKDYPAIKRVLMKSFLLLGITMSVLAIPFIIYPHLLLSFLSTTLPSGLLLATSYSSWIYLLCEGILLIGMGLLAATRQTSFFIFTGCFQWVTSYGLVVMAINSWHWRAEAFWLLTGVNALVIAALYFFRAKQLINPLFNPRRQALPG